DRRRLVEALAELLLEQVDLVAEVLRPAGRVAAELEDERGVVLPGGGPEPGAEQADEVLARAQLRDVEEPNPVPIERLAVVAPQRQGGGRAPEQGWVDAEGTEPDSRLGDAAVDPGAPRGLGWQDDEVVPAALLDSGGVDTGRLEHGVVDVEAARLEADLV